jgi:hypothetical protein
MRDMLFPYSGYENAPVLLCPQAGGDRPLAEINEHVARTGSVRYTSKILFGKLERKIRE